MKYSILLFDADDTLFDFGACERIAFKETMADFGIFVDETMAKRYAEINDACWKRFERRDLEKKELVVLRFALFLQEYGKKGDPAAINARYIEALSRQVILLEGARELLETLKGKVRMFIITNGTYAVQTGRFARSGLLPYFEEVFISEKMGTQKPEKRFFQMVEEAIDGFEKEKALVIGDSLTSDMAGAYAYGLDRLWFNPKGKENTAGLPLTGQVGGFEELLDFLLAND
ncbi:MAG: YjjG family noncanonical pyrimidine nucleotidase [Clostridia bacterium]|nr:YjjG family noncanonical pyrimidine nucleotidase [Clostridia bacterium]